LEFALLGGEVWLDTDVGESDVEKEMNDAQNTSMVLGEDHSDHEEEESQVAMPIVTHVEAETAFSTCI